LKFIEEAEWDAHQTYDQKPPPYICYSFSWKVTLKRHNTQYRRKVSSDMELNVVLAPGRYWERVLRGRLADLVAQKFLGSPLIRPDDTDVVVTVNERSQPDFNKRFPGIDVNWTMIQTQVETRSPYLEKGKMLQVKLSFNYIQTGELPVGNSEKRGEKRGRNSTTQRMLNDLDLRVDAEEVATGQAVIWRKVYALMRCPGPPCPHSRYCWIDPVGKKHHRLLNEHLKRLVKYVERGGKLESHADMPCLLREELYEMEKQQRRQKRSNRWTESPDATSAVTINVLPIHDQPASVPGGPTRSVGPVQIWETSPARVLDIEGPRDVAVKQYSQWLQSQYQDRSLKEEVRKAERAVLEEGFSLVQIYGERGAEFLTGREVKQGIAESFTNDVAIWHRYQNRCPTDLEFANERFSRVDETEIM
jgi:hypothetical protein